MKLSLEAQMMPLWPSAYSPMTWRAPTEDLWAVSKWIDLHIANPSLNLGYDEFLAAVRYAGLNEGHRGLGLFQSAVIEWRDRHRKAHGALDRIMQRLGIPEERRREVLEDGAEAVYNLAGLSPAQRRALELSLVFRREDGTADCVKIAAHMDGDKRFNGGKMTQAAVYTHLARALKKVRAHLR